MEENLSKIIKRIKQLKGLQTDTQVAQLLGMSRENLNNYKRRNSIPRKAIETFCLHDGISLNYILYGIEPVRIEEATRPANAEDKRQKELLKAAEEILSSGNKESVRALAHCIEYLSEVLEKDRRMLELENKVRRLEDCRDGPQSSGPEDGSYAPGHPK